MISSKNNYCENFPYYYGKCMIIGKKDEIQKMHYIEVREKTFILKTSLILQFTTMILFAMFLFVVVV